MIFQLRVLDLSPVEAEELAHKLDVCGSTYARITADDYKKAKDEADMKRRTAAR